MAEIIVAPHAGFCFGVRRAIALAEKVCAEEGGKRIWSMGRTLGYLQEAGGIGVVVEKKEDLEKLKNLEKVGIVAQTTQSEQFFKEVVGELALWVKELKVINTICNATSERQEDVYELAGKVDVMIIVGGKNSGNTRRLYQISSSLNPRSYHIETAEELKPEWFVGAQRVGITAGASTPDWIIQQVKSKVQELLS
jgi:4-hydroxy-3-methylbut-2-enyl diphosphate reductase